MAPTQQTILFQKIQTAMLSLITAGIIGCFSFLWHINAEVSGMQVNIQNNKENIVKLDNRIDFMEKNIADHADRITKLELKK